MRAWNPSRALPGTRAAVAGLALLAAGLAATPVAAGELHDQLAPFLRRSATASAEGLDSLATSFNPAQLPLLAWGLWEEERREGPSALPVYEALVRWHRWLGTRLDPTNDGLWKLDPRWLGEAGGRAHRRSAALASLELPYLEVLAGMAARQGGPFDALVWWRDHALLRDRLLSQLHDGSRGGFADLDSNGRVIEDPASWAGLLPAAFGVPLHREAAALRLRRQLGLVEERGARVDAAQRQAALMALDPLAGWEFDPALSFLEPQASALLLAHAADQLRDPPLAELVEDILPELGYPTRRGLELPLGPLRLGVELRPDTSRPLRAAAVAVDFLWREAFVPAPEALPLLEALRSGQAPPDSLAGALGDALARWATADLDELRRRLKAQRNHAPPVDPEGSSPFRYRPRDADMWARASFDRLREAVLDLHLRVDHDAGYRAWLEPAVSPRGNPITVRVELAGRQDPGPATATPWQAMWTDGRDVLPAVPLAMRPAPGGDPSILVGRLAQGPDEPGLWWLLLFGPAGRPHAPAELDVVEPLRAELHELAAEGGTRAFELRLVNQVTSPLQGRYELRHPTSWGSSPAGGGRFALGPRGRSAVRLELSPSPGTPPGPYNFSVRVFDEREAVAEVHGDLAIHYDWVTLGPLAAPLGGGLQQALPPDAAIELQRRYQGPAGELGWRHLAPQRLGEGGWVTLAQPSDPAGVYYGLTAVTTTSREATLVVVANRPTLARVNGEDLVRLGEGGGAREASLRLLPGANYVVVKQLAGGGLSGRFRLELEDVTGGSLLDPGNDLAQMLDGYRYLDGGVELSPEQQQRVELRLVTVTYDDPRARSVSVVGSFNGWSPRAHPMRRRADGLWAAEIPLRLGRFEYKFAVDGDNWRNDPRNHASVADGFGGLNSLLVVD